MLSWASHFVFLCCGWHHLKNQKLLKTPPKLHTSNKCLLQYSWSGHLLLSNPSLRGLLSWLPSKRCTADIKLLFTNRHLLCIHHISWNNSQWDWIVEIQSPFPILFFFEGSLLNLGIVSLYTLTIPESFSHNSHGNQPELCP